MKSIYEAPGSELLVRCKLEEAVTCSGGLIVLPDDEFNP